MIVHAFLLDAHPQSPSILGLRDDAQHDAVRWHGRALPQRCRVRRGRFLKVYRILAWPSAAWLAMLWGALTGFPAVDKTWLGGDGRHGHGFGRNARHDAPLAPEPWQQPGAVRQALKPVDLPDWHACGMLSRVVRLGSVLKPGLLWCCKLNHHGGHTGKGC